jgi:FtsP/CotA-like multicopper oxidase with cupredoxin domain
VNEPAETNAGLLGPSIITRRGFAKSAADPSPRDVDREFVTAFFIFNELAGEEAGLMHAINGYIFGNLRGLVMRNGEKVRWHLLGMGNEVDLHSPHFHGKTVRVGVGPAERSTDVIELLPGSMVTVDMQADNPGEWLFHCHVADHIDAGMITTYQILP